MQERMQDFSSMLRAVLGGRVASDAATFVDMLAPNAVMEFPFAPHGLPTRLKGQEAIARHLRKLAGLIEFDGIGPATPVVSDGDVTVIAFEASGRGRATGSIYAQRYLSIIETGGGRIVRYVDYWNPIPVAQALLGDAAVEGLDLRDAYHG